MKYLLWTLVLALAAPTFASPAPSPVVKRQTASTCTLPSGYSFASTSLLPNPFVFANGTALTQTAQWACRQGEINDAFQKYELGALPPKPSTVTGSLSGTTFTVSVTDSGKSATFTATVTRPSSGTAPYPAIIGIGGISFPQPAGVAVINFPNDDVALENDGSSRGVGKFYNVYGTSASAGALMAWTWGVSRLIDVIEQVGTSLIDVNHLGVSGCSRDGKGAFVVGAFEPRIALTIPQESGSGGSACWRVSDDLFADGNNIQTAHEIVQENVWFSTLFNPYATATSTLPIDHHELAALVAPRGLFVIDNDIDWLGPVSQAACMEAGQMVYSALGVPDAFGYSLVGNHAHCSFPSSQQANLTLYINKYLLGSSTPTGFVRDNSGYGNNNTAYISWTAPTLS
ncbi:hypothetical protein B7494_g5487 [Chlorociboria aeruginascens]|nr:hypothetical protein B7494_g5487 [Chlorociboria aeruginascens]